jgi:hypothetical protein
VEILLHQLHGYVAQRLHVARIGGAADLLAAFMARYFSISDEAVEILKLTHRF